MFNPYQNQMNQIMKIQNEASAMSFPLAQGQSMTFIDETKPFIYVKTMGLSQFEKPRFEKYKIEKVQTEQVNDIDVKTEIIELKKQIEELRGKINESIITESTVTDDVTTTGKSSAVSIE